MKKYFTHGRGALSMSRLFTLLAFLILIVKMNYASSNELSKESYHYVSLKAPTKVERQKIANLIHIDQYIDGIIHANVNQHDLQQLKKVVPSLIVEQHKVVEFDNNTINNLESYEFPEGDESFHTYEEVVNSLKGLQRQYPNLAEYFEIGTTIEGLPIPGIKISSVKKAHKDEFIPGILFIGSHHAREHLSTEVPILLSAHILNEYKLNPRIKTLVDSREIYIVPMLNPDGAMFDITNKKYKMWRKNRRVNTKKIKGVDLNRNYSQGWGGRGSSGSPRSDIYRGPKPFSEPESSAIKAFIESKPSIRMMLSFHTYSELILYPWGGSNDEVGGVDQKIFEKMARTMAKWNNYKPMQSSDLYIATGDTCDWAYKDHGIYCFTFELSPKNFYNGGFYPGAGIIERVFKANIGPSLYLIEHTANPRGVLK
jgi:carboxypeptidase T